MTNARLRMKLISHPQGAVLTKCTRQILGHRHTWKKPTITGPSLSAGSVQLSWLCSYVKLPVVAGKFVLLFQSLYAIGRNRVRAHDDLWEELTIGMYACQNQPFTFIFSTATVIIMKILHPCVKIVIMLVIETRNRLISNIRSILHFCMKIRVSYQSSPTA